MGIRYIIQGATHCGDGTASNEAASAGAPGAWNRIDIEAGVAPLNTTNVPTAGDVIYIRSKTSAGADITVTVTTAPLNIGLSSATDAAPVTWILDNGEIWPDAPNGTLTYSAASSANYVNVLAHNIIVSKTKGNRVFINTVTTGNSGGVFSVAKGAEAIGIKIDTLARTSASNTNDVRVHGTITDGIFKFGAIVATGVLQLNSDNQEGYLINPDIELASTANLTTGVLFGALGVNRRLTVIGGLVYGAGADAGLLLSRPATTNQGVGLKLVGFRYPNTMKLPATLVATSSSAPECKFYDVDGAFGSLLLERWGWMSSRQDNNPPKLNALLPNGNDKWAWRVYPEQASRLAPMLIPISKAMIDTAAIKTVTLELLIATTYPALNKSNLFIDVIYVDSTTGLPVYISSRTDNGGSLDTSTVTWSIDPPTWGEVSFNKRKISVTTPTAIKQNTSVIVNLGCTVKSATMLDIMFVCPDVQLL